MLRASCRKWYAGLLKHPEQLNDDQRRCIGFLEGSLSGIVWADCGVGKTVSAETALKNLIDRFDVRRVLVVGPRLVAERVWGAEAGEWSHLAGLRVVRVVGTEKQRLRALEQD